MNGEWSWLKHPVTVALGAAMLGGGAGTGITSQAMGYRMDQVEAKLVRLAQQEERLDKVEKSVVRIEGTVERIEERQVESAKDMEKTEEKAEESRKRLRSIERKLDVIVDRYDRENDG